MAAFLFIVISRYTFLNPCSIVWHIVGLCYKQICFCLHLYLLSLFTGTIIIFLCRFNACIHFCSSILYCITNIGIVNAIVFGLLPVVACVGYIRYVGDIFALKT